jgi:hypothetical protein
MATRYRRFHTDTYSNSDADTNADANTYSNSGS